MSSAVITNIEADARDKLSSRRETEDTCMSISSLRSMLASAGEKPESWACAPGAAKGSNRTVINRKKSGRLLLVVMLFAQIGISGFECCIVIQSKLQRIFVFLFSLGGPAAEMNDFKEWQRRS